MHPAKDAHPERAARAERPQSAKCQHCNRLQPLCPLFAAFSTPRLFVFNSLQPLLQKHPGWGYPGPMDGLSARVDEASRCRRWFCRTPGWQFGSPQPAKSFASYHILTTLAFSSAYALFRATAARQTLSPQALTHSFHRNGGVPPRCSGFDLDVFCWPTMLSSMTIP
jgi:hypothetical protein